MILISPIRLIACDLHAAIVREPINHAHIHLSIAFVESMAVRHDLNFHASSSFHCLAGSYSSEVKYTAK